MILTCECFCLTLTHKGLSDPTKLSFIIFLFPQISTFLVICITLFPWSWKYSRHIGTFYAKQWKSNILFLMFNLFYKNLLPSLQKFNLFSIFLRKSVFPDTIFVSCQQFRNFHPINYITHNTNQFLSLKLEEFSLNQSSYDISNKSSVITGTTLCKCLLSLTYS